MSAPPNVTPYGKIAYRLDELAQRLIDRDENAANTLWGIIDDLVALNMAPSSDAVLAAKVRACRPCTAVHSTAHHFVHVSDNYDDGCWEYARTLLDYLLEGDTP